MTERTHSPYGGYHEGDHVTRDGTDVQLVKDMTADGFAATFVCVVAPASGWCEVGEEEHNLCRRYERVTFNDETGAWEAAPGERQWVLIDPHELARRLCKKLIQDLSAWAASWATAAIAGGATSSSFAQAWNNSMRRHRSRPYYRRNFKRRALRK